MPSHKVLPTGVNPSGLTALIQNLGRDCHPSQFVREFTRNAIEACLRTGEKNGKVSVDYNRMLFDEHGLYKICFTDAGDGMTEKQMLDLLNSLSASGDSKNEFVNYGVGAKISALTRNHEGIWYESWRGGVGYGVVIKYHKDQHLYGIEGATTPDGSQTIYAVELPASAKPANIDQHGTRVTLFGMASNQDTMFPPEGVSGIRESWLALYLNSRFFVLPEGIELSARIGYYRENNPKHNYLLAIRGQKAILDEKADLKGITGVDGAKIHWWVMPKGIDGHGRELLKGHTALVNQGEIFDVSDARSSRSSFFGVIVGRDRVIIYVEPENAVQNTARTGLLRPDGSALTWDRWQDEFRSNMPPELKVFLDTLLSEGAKDSHTESIRERLKSLQALYKVSRYKQVTQSTMYAEADSVSTFETAAPVNGEPSGIAKKLNKKPGSVPGSLATSLLTTLVEKQNGVPVSEVAPDPFPTVKWVSVAEAEQLTDRAAEYVSTAHMILANKEFQGLLDLISYFTKQYAEVPEVTQVIEEESRVAFEQALTECVAGALSLKNRKHWNPSDFDKAISKEALTTAVMARYWMVNHVKRVLNSKIKGYAETAT